jgi:hypothetical protein
VIQTHIGAEFPREQRMLFSRIAADEQDGGSVGNVTEAGGAIVAAGKRVRKGRIVGGALMVDIVGTQNCARELLQQVILFVRGQV